MDIYIWVVYVEFVVYNLIINMVVVVIIIFELFFLGGVFKSYEIYVVNMYSFLRKYLVVRIIGEVIVVILLVVMLVCVGFMIFYDKFGYFKDFFKVLDFVLVLIGVVIVFLWLFKEGFKKFVRD